MCAIFAPFVKRSARGIPADQAEGPQGEEFGMEKVAAFAKTHAANSAARINQHLLAQLTEFFGA